METLLSADDRGRLLAEARGAVADALAGRPPRRVAAEGIFARRAGVFVSFHLDGVLRGCIGHPDGDQPLASVVPQCAVAAATGDPRFDPVSPGELARCVIEISVLGPITAVQDPGEIVIGRHGLIAAQGSRRGLLLPQVATEWQWDLETFVSQACRKAGLPPDAWRTGARLYRFEALVFGEGDAGTQ